MHRAKESMKDICENFLNALSEKGDTMTDMDIASFGETAAHINEICEAIWNACEMKGMDYNLDHSEALHHRRGAQHMGAEHMEEYARHRRAEHYEGEMVGTDSHGNKVRYEGRAEVQKNLR